MMTKEEHQNCVHELNIQTKSENVGLCVDRADVPGIRKVGLRAEIDTSSPFGSVQEAVTRFGGRGYWVPYKLQDNYNHVGEFDLKRMEEHAAELEKDLIVKELETLDVLEALGSTKRIVEDLKRQLHQESLREAENLSSDIKDMNNKHCNYNPMSSPNLILMELKQAKINLSKTMDDLVMIQSSVESLNKKMKEEKNFLDKTRAKLTYGFGGPVSLAEELSRVRVKPHETPMEQVKKVAETGLNQQNKNCLRTAEMRLVAAKKMEQAARAVEALAIAEITMLSSSSSSNGESECFLPKPLESPLTPRGLRNITDFSTFNKSRNGVLKKLEEATEHLPMSQTRRSFFSHRNKKHEPLNNLSKPVLKSNVSMRDVIRRKQVPKEDVVVAERQSIEGNMNLSQTMKVLKQDIKEEVHEEKQFVTQRRKFGFIHIRLPMQKQNKKKSSR